MHIFIFSIHHFLIFCLLIYVKAVKNLLKTILQLEYSAARCILWVIVNAFTNNKGFVIHHCLWGLMHTFNAMLLQVKFIHNIYTGFSWHILLLLVLFQNRPC